MSTVDALRDYWYASGAALVYLADALKATDWCAETARGAPDAVVAGAIGDRACIAWLAARPDAESTCTSRHTTAGRDR